MSLPKRDDVNGRCYLIYKPDTSWSVLAQADLFIQDVLDSTARENHSHYPIEEASDGMDKTCADSGLGKRCPDPGWREEI